MSEHSEHYHDADRNKPLPGATVSSKEEVLQTLLTAARGEITALTEANKLLAAQVGSEHGIVINDLNLRLSAEMRRTLELQRVCDERGLRLKRLEIAVDRAKVSARAADAPSEPSELVLRLRNIVAEDVTPYFCVNVPKDLLRSAADALDSQPTEAIALLCEVEGMQNIAETYASGAVVSDEFEALRDRISEFLSSQPTDGEVRNG